jgi:3D (Asp-Asp-Asp) domain-containing protein
MSCLTGVTYTGIGGFDVLPTRLSSVQRSRTLIAVALVLTIPGLSALRGLDAADGPSRVVTFHPRTGYTKNVFEEAGIPKRAEAPTTARIAAGCVTRHIVTRKLPIERAIERIIDPKMDRGTSRVVREGSDGEMIQAVLVKRGDNGVISETVLSERVWVRPQPKVIATGSREPLRVLLTSRGNYTYRTVMTMTATAYEPSPRSCGKYADGYTAIGMKAAPGVVAVDPRVIPLRTRLYVEGYGPALAADVGAAIKGNRIDVFFETVDEALRYGRRQVNVYILEDR